MVRIHDFAKKHGVDKRSIDYWTTIGLLHPEVHENGYRDYGDQADEEIGYIFIASMMNRPCSLKDAVNDIRGYDERQWRKCINDMQDQMSSYTEKYDIAYRVALKAIER